MSLLEIKNLKLTIDETPILNGVNLDLWEGYVHAIVGPNGAGKSSLSFAIMGLEGYRDIEGDIRFDGESITSLSIDERARKGITLGWQEPARYEGLPMDRFITAGSKDKSEAFVRDLLSKVGLDPHRYLHRAVDKSLSGGERKKVELASILAMKPRLVMMDEPDSGIDVESLHRIGDAIEILKANGSTVLLITHSVEVLQWAEHAFLMCSGQILDKSAIADAKQYFESKCVPCDHLNRPLQDEN
jgi:Fe-S cluster assembly ATP-binding protein